ncbi:MAG: PilW family protein [Desulfobacula sp.]|nr:PilW family protein [Desulfobacula sp.]
MAPIKQHNYNAGFTLIEIMITLLLSSIVIGAVFMTYSNQQKTYISTDNLADLQQNLRAAIMIMSTEIREAGCDPTQDSEAGVVTATSTHFRFTRDIKGHTLAPDTRADGDVDDTQEDIEFGFSTASVDTNDDGIADAGIGGIGDLGRQTGGAGGFQPIAENIQAIEFNYILESGNTVSNPNSSQLNQIRGVQVSLLARSSVIEQNFTNTQQYTTISGTTWGPYNDNYKRRFVSVTIMCRNLGM